MRSLGSSGKPVPSAARLRPPVFDEHFVTGDPGTLVALTQLVRAMLARLESRPGQAYSGMSPAALADLLSCELDALQPASGEQVFERLAAVVDHSINLNHPNAIAHLHCPTLLPAVAADMMIGALNPSMDSFDQAPAATVIELQMIRYLCERA